MALNLAESTPSWLESLAASPMTLGLDLRGGVHFLLEVDMDAAITQRLESDASAMRTTLRDERLRYRNTKLGERSISMDFMNAEDRDEARQLIAPEYPEFDYSNVERARGAGLKMTLTDTAVDEIQDYAVNQNLTTLRNRVNELGVSEPLVQRQGRTVSSSNCPASRIPQPPSASSAPRPIWSSASRRGPTPRMPKPRPSRSATMKHVPRP